MSLGKVSDVSRVLPTGRVMVMSSPGSEIVRRAKGAKEKLCRPYGTRLVLLPYPGLTLGANTNSAPAELSGCEFERLSRTPFVKFHLLPGAGCQSPDANRRIPNSDCQC